MTKQEAIEILHHTIAFEGGFAEAKRMAIEALEKEPSRADGEWIPRKFPYDWYYPTCSVCGFENKGELSNYCPNCGSDMRGADNE